MSWATIDLTGMYRYTLGRDIDLVAGHGRVVFIMLNPSTADAKQDDPTIRKCMGFARRLGAMDMEVVNLFAFRSTNPINLFTAVDPVGYDNDAIILSACTHLRPGVTEVVAAWGNHGNFRGRAQQVMEMLSRHHIKVQTLGHNKTGSPKHPLYVPYSAQLKPL